MSDLLDSVEASAGLAVFGAAGVPGTSAARAALLESGVPGLLAARDPTLWGDRAEPVARNRLGWLDTHQRSRALLPELRALRARHVDAGLARVVAVASGGAAAAARAITRTLGVPLTVLDGTDPHQLARIDLRSSTVVIVGRARTPEHDTLLKLAADSGAPLVVVTDAGSDLAEFAAARHATTVLADPEVDERFGALSAYGLVPAALAGVDVATLLDEADAIAPSLGAAADNPALALAVALAEAARDRRDKLLLADDGSGIVGLSAWIEQLVANATDLVPVVLASPASPGNSGDDVVSVTVGGALTTYGIPGGGANPDLAVNGPLGAQFLVWAFATALVARALGNDPFGSCADPVPASDDAVPVFVDGHIEVYGTTAATTVHAALSGLVNGVHPHGYLAVTAFLDPDGESQVEQVRDLLAARAARPVTFGWGQGAWRTTGRLHHDGPRTGSFLQLTGGSSAATAAGGELQAAQAAADLRALAATGRPVLRLHFPRRAAGIAQLLGILQN